MSIPVNPLKDEPYKGRLATAGLYDLQRKGMGRSPWKGPTWAPDSLKILVTQLLRQRCKAHVDNWPEWAKELVPDGNADSPATSVLVNDLKNVQAAAGDPFKGLKGRYVQQFFDEVQAHPGVYGFPHGLLATDRHPQASAMPRPGGEIVRFSSSSAGPNSAGPYRSHQDSDIDRVLNVAIRLGRRGTVSFSELRPEEQEWLWAKFKEFPNRPTWLDGNILNTMNDWREREHVYPFRSQGFNTRDLKSWWAEMSRRPNDTSQTSVATQGRETSEQLQLQLHRDPGASSRSSYLVQQSPYPLPDPSHPRHPRQGQVSESAKSHPYEATFPKNLLADFFFPFQMATRLQELQAPCVRWPIAINKFHSQTGSSPSIVARALKSHL
ncbi:hypothetical protein T439DRAFT_323189 [Meredithblackwellia eburnea MCA 4105]